MILEFPDRQLIVCVELSFLINRSYKTLKKSRSNNRMELKQNKMYHSTFKFFALAFFPSVCGSGGVEQTSERESERDRRKRDMDMFSLSLSLGAMSC